MKDWGSWDLLTAMVWLCQSTWSKALSAIPVFSLIQTLIFLCPPDVPGCWPVHGHQCFPINLKMGSYTRCHGDNVAEGWEVVRCASQFTCSYVELGNLRKLINGGCSDTWCNDTLGSVLSPRWMAWWTSQLGDNVSFGKVRRCRCLDFAILVRELSLSAWISIVGMVAWKCSANKSDIAMLIANHNLLL
jgi:hypothetical protein